jgi:anti-sigma regulatory factor (Ser/Thr protein kinase)
MCHTPVPDFSLTFPPDPAWVRTCREAVRTSMLGVKQPALTELAVLLTSEGVTNAINACTNSGCPQPITLYGEWLETGPLRIHVRDAAPGLPVLHGLTDQSEHGRGMHLITELANRHGICLDGPGPGKSLWFQLEEDAG